MMGTTSKYMKRSGGKRVMKFESGGRVPGTTDTGHDGSVLWRSGKMTEDDLKKLTYDRIEKGERGPNLDRLARTRGHMAWAEINDRMDEKYPTTKTPGRRKD